MITAGDFRKGVTFEIDEKASKIGTKRRENTKIIKMEPKREIEKEMSNLS